MARVKIKFPDLQPLFSCIIPVRITDVNYGNHLGNDSLLSILHESRVQMLQNWQFTELDAGGTSLIMADVMIAYKGEAFYGDELKISIYSDAVTERSFDLLYRVSNVKNELEKPIAEAKTGMVCFDYETRQIAVMKEKLKNRLLGMEMCG